MASYFGGASVISIVVGKPGSGKSYYVVSKLCEQLEEMLIGLRDRRKVVTNLSLQKSELVKYLSDRHKKIDISVIEELVNSSVRVLELHDLQYNRDYVEDGEEYQKRVAGKVIDLIAPTSRAFWWNRLEQESLIVIDEFQRYVSSSGESTESERQSLIDFFSTHRHKAQDWILLSQNLMSISIDVRRVTEEVSTILNAKSVIIPFPVNIPLRDVQFLLYAFGKYNQVFRVKTAQLLNSNRLSKDDVLQEVVKTEAAVFKCYQTRTRGGQNSKGVDGALPYSTQGNIRWNAVKWFFWKHAGHIMLKVLAVVLISVCLNHFEWFTADQRKKSVAKEPEKSIKVDDRDLTPTRPVVRKNDVSIIIDDEISDELAMHELYYYRRWLSNVQRIRRGEPL